VRRSTVPELRLSLACGPYDRTEALRTGVVRPEGIELVYVPVQSPPELFARMVSTECFDVSEMSCSLYFIRKSRGDFPFVALPVFPSRMFRHGFVFVNRDSGIEHPKDLDGKRVGVPEYSQTAAVWIRGILQDEYGVDWRSCQWYTGGVNAIGRPDTLVEWPRLPLSIQRVFDRTLNDMLTAGELDALLGARIPKSLGRDPRVRRLFPNYREVEKDYYRGSAAPSATPSRGYTRSWRRRRRCWGKTLGRMAWNPTGRPWRPCCGTWWNRGSWTGRGPWRSSSRR
jgi:4,5-dihydroxyphthalate decarboxylase